MRIAQVAPLYEAVPPQFYGGTERVVATLTDALVALGHDVTLFASADANTTARLVAVRDQAIRLDPAPLKSDLAAHMAMLARVRRSADQFDVIHLHTDILHFPFFADIAERTITTLHGRLDLKDLPQIFQLWPQFPLVSISDDQRRPLASANWRGTVHHGVSAETFQFRAAGDGYLAFLGRISPEKQPDQAIAIASRLGRKLKIAAKVDPVDREYFHAVVEPLLRTESCAEFIGEISEAQKSDFLGGADALLFPIDWPEPFGLVMIEAMACGTPVVAYDRGSVPEIVEDGVTGFIVQNQDEAIAALRRVPTLDRRRIRARFETRFSSKAMALRYLSLYADLGTHSVAPAAAVMR
jgi:glycosyltransferase involved in cell wall biosynthesis